MISLFHSPTKYGFLYFVFLISFTVPGIAQKNASNKGYQNPIIHADYSDPDVIRVGNDYYMTASSFNHVPGLPILHSRDLVNWTLKGYALKNLFPEEHFKKVRHGGGVWAPSIRFHQSKFYIYYPDPDFGIYVITAQNINGPWSSPILVESGKGLIDPCPLWDDDGKVYLVHAYAGSRASIKSILVLKEMNKQGTKVISDPVMIFDGHDKDTTVEGPKIHKRHGYYYVFSPAGGVSTGWQLVLRSKHIYGPYERKMVMHQGKTTINGPHQGAWVDTPSGENWFFHFQDKGAYGRIVHLQPLRWVNDWPVIGEDLDGDGCGEPKYSYGVRKLVSSDKRNCIQSNDEFNSAKIGKHWQWQANPEQSWAMATSDGYYRMYSVLDTAQLSDVWNYPNILGQKFHVETFSATLNVTFKPRFNGEKFGYVVLGTDLAYISLVKKEDGIFIEYVQRINAEKTLEEQIITSHKLSSGKVLLKIEVSKGGICHFSYSQDIGKSYKKFNQSFTAKPGKWVGAKIGMFMSRINITNDSGFADVDWFRVE